MSMFLIGCSNTEESVNSSNESSDTIKVFTTIFPLEDFTKKIGGEHVSVTSVFPAGADAHTYEPSTKQMVEMANGDLFIYTGIGLEGFAEKAHETLENENVKILKAGENLDLLSHNHEHAHEEEEHANEEEHAHEDEHAHEEEQVNEEENHHHDHDKDPHVWLDPILAEQVAENIKNTLIELKPDAQEDFEKNFQALVEQFHSLDAEMNAIVEKAERKEIVVSHAAYGYWEERYGIEQISISGLSPTEEPSQKELAHIIEKAQEYNIKYVIFENNVSSNVANIVQSELNAEALTLHNLESITEEQMEEGKDYFDIMKENIETLKKALNVRNS